MSESLSIADLTSDPKNARRHTPRNIGMIAESLQRFGAARGIVVDEHGTVLAGNGVLEAAAQAGIENVRLIPVDGHEIVAIQVSHLSTEQKAQYAIADNRTGELSEWDAGQLQALIDDGVDLSMFWFDEELDALLAENVTVTEPLTDPDDVPAVPDDPITKPGDVWLLGRHRVMCGDSTVVTDVDRLMAGQKADMVFTDPPYNVGYAYATYDDTKTQDEYIQLLRDAIPMDGKTIVNNGNTKIEDMIRAFGKPYHVGIWLKTNAMSPSAISNFSVWEPIFFYGKFKRRIGNDLFDYPISKQPDTGDHTCPKPIKMCVDMIREFNDGGPVYDPFLGSGSTLIACEQVGVACYGSEIDPAYTDVICKRWADFTGGDPVRQDGVKWSEANVRA